MSSMTDKYKSLIKLKTWVYAVFWIGIPKEEQYVHGVHLTRAEAEQYVDKYVKKKENVFIDKVRYNNRKHLVLIYDE